MNEYLWIPAVIGFFLVVLLAAIAIKRAIVFGFKRITGRDKIEAAEREALRRKYENPDWEFYENFLGGSVPRSMKLVWESPRLRESPIVRYGEDEYFLYPICSDGLAGDRFYPLGQNELGAAIYLDSHLAENDRAVFVYETDAERQLLHEDAQEFFSQIAKENHMN